MEVIIRPHPDNHISSKFSKTISSFGLKLDLAFTEYLKERKCDGVPAKSADFIKDAQKSLNYYLSNAACVMSEGGTLCLEARSVNIPVAVLANNPWQITSRHFLQFDHFQPLCTKNGVLTILSIDQWAEDFCIWLSSLNDQLGDIDQLLNTKLLQTENYITHANNFFKKYLK